MSGQPLPQSSIHHQRRWFYVLWVVLLLGSLGLLVAWRIPKVSGTWTLRPAVLIRQLPGRCSVEVWAGPRAAWDHPTWQGAVLVQQTQLDSDARVQLNPVKMAIALRRWTGYPIAERTWDACVLKITSPAGETRFMAYPLKPDLVSGILVPRRILMVDMESRWPGLSLTPPTGSKLP